MSNQQPLRIGIVGAGGRGVGGYLRYFEKSSIKAEVQAIADPSKVNVEHCLKVLTHQARPPVVYQDWRKMLDTEEHFDGMIIATPNFLHGAPALASLEKGVRAMALEKPLANTPEECRLILRRSEELSVPIQLGFVFRSAPFFSTVKRLLQEGVVGRIVSMQADELVSARTTAVNFRGPWRKYAARSGGSLLEKCCHDMDLLTWFAGSRPATVSSYGGRLIFQANAALPDRCGSHCPAKDNCPYYIGNASMSNFPGEGKVDPLCVYNAGGDVVDHQSVHIQYENGVVCNFLMNFNTGGDRSTRNLHIVGTRGRIWGNETDKAVMSHDMATDRVTRHPFERDNSSHSGGNRIHAEEFLRLVAGETHRPVAGVYDAYLSAMLCFAADRARLERRLVGIRYPLEREVELV